MKRRRIIAVLIAVICTVVIGAIVWPREREPEYNGKKLSGWLAQYPVAKLPSAEREAAAQAVRAIGTNGIPYLLHAISYEPPKWRKYVERYRWKLPIRLSLALQDRGKLKDWGASLGFEILGPSASPAVPELTRLLRGPRRFRAIAALGAIGQDGFPPLLAELENPNGPGRWDTASAIYRMESQGVDISPAVPLLLLRERANTETPCER